MTSAVDIGLLRKQALEKTKTPVDAPKGSAPTNRPKPTPKTITFPVQIQNVQTGEMETYNLSSTIIRDLDGAIDRTSRSLAGAPLTDFLPFQQDRFLQIARCIAQLDNWDLDKRLSTKDELARLEGHIFDNAIVREHLVGRLVEHQRRFLYGSQPPTPRESAAGDGAEKAPLVVVGELDAPHGNSG